MKKKKKIILGIATGLVAIIIAGLTILPFIVINPMVNRHCDFSHVWAAEDFGLTAYHFFAETEDGLKISSYEVPVDNPKAVIICLSGIHGPSVTAYFGHARLFTAHGYATVLLDMRAHGESEGNRICLGYKEYLDVKAVLQYLKSNPAYEGVPIVVMGVSMGGATAINSIGELPEIDGLISLSAYSSWEEVFYENMKTQAPAFLALISKPFISLSSFLKYGSESCTVKPIKEIKKLGHRPALLMHSLDDSQVPYANFERLLSQAPERVETFVREGDKHFITESFIEPEQDNEYAEVLINFLNKHFCPRITQ